MLGNFVKLGRTIDAVEDFNKHRVHTGNLEVSHVEISAIVRLNKVGFQRKHVFSTMTKGTGASLHFAASNT